MSNDVYKDKSLNTVKAGEDTEAPDLKPGEASAEVHAAIKARKANKKKVKKDDFVSLPYDQRPRNVEYKTLKGNTRIDRSGPGE